MELYLRFALLLLGMVYLTTESAIFSPVRMWIARGRFLTILAYCAACQGFWWGLLTAWWVGMPVLDGGLAGMALGAIWVNARGGNATAMAEGAMEKLAETEDGQ